MSYKYIQTTEGELTEGNSFVFNVSTVPRPYPDTELITITLSDGSIVEKYGWSYGGRNTVQKFDTSSQVVQNIYQNTSAWTGYYAIALFGNSLRFYGSNQPIESITSETNYYASYSLRDEDFVMGKDWDETPGEPTDPTESIGGANAILDDLTSDYIGFEITPWDTEQFVTTHTHNRFMQPYLLNQTQFAQLENIFWEDVGNPSSFFNQLASLVFNGYQDPMSCIAGLIRLPLPYNAISTSGSGNIYLGGQKVESASGDTVNGSWLSSRYAKVIYQLHIGEVWGSYQDYLTTSLSLYLPYVSTINLGVECINSNIVVSYLIDCFTGDLLCTVGIMKNNTNNHGTFLDSTIGRYKGNCAMQTIYSRGNTQQHAQNIINGAFSLAGNVASGNYMGILQGTTNLMTDQRIKTEQGGSVSGASGWFDYQTPYLIIKRGVPKYPIEYKSLLGRPQFQKLPVSACSGFTRFDSIHVDSVPCTDEERTEIESILKGGFIA